MPPGVREANAESDDVSSNADDDSQLDNESPPHDDEHNDPSNNHDEQSQAHDTEVIRPSEYVNDTIPSSHASVDKRTLDNLQRAADITKIYMKLNKILRQQNCDNDLRPEPNETRLITFNPGPLKRLGNLMFNFAAVIGIAKHTDLKAVIPQDTLLQAHFNFTPIPEVNYTQAFQGAVRLHEKRAGIFTPSVFHQAKCRNTSVLLKGYLQSWKYFALAKSDVIAAFRFKAEIEQQASDVVTRLKQEQKSSSTPPLLVGIHVRRGDYVREKNYKDGRRVAPPDYYPKAMRYFTDKFPNKRVIFVVCSDDLQWCKNLTKFVEFDVRLMSKHNSPGLDLAILSKCDHTIMSVGTFGWWAGYLANGTTVYYKNWLEPNTYIGDKYNDEDFFPPEWIAM